MAYLVAVGALIYVIAFWARDAVSCLAASSGCEVRGDATAMLIVLTGFSIVTALVLAGYFFIVRRFVRIPVNRQILSRVLMLVSALVYSLGFGLAALELLGNRNAFWMSAVIGSVIFSTWCALWAFDRNPPRRAHRKDADHLNTPKLVANATGATVGIAGAIFIVVLARLVRRQT
jgi:hypothetical protein